MNATRNISRGIRAMVPGAVSLIEDATLLGGAGSIAYGVWLIYAPAGFITAGVLAIAGVIMKARGAV